MNNELSSSTPKESKRQKKKSWKKVSSASSYLQFEYGDHHKNGTSHSVHTNSVRTSSINDMANYGFDDIEYQDLETLISGNKALSHASSKSIKNLQRHSLYQNSYDAQINAKFKAKHMPHSNHLIMNRRKLRRKKSKYTITDIFASNSSFILDHEYNEDDICNLILSNSTQTQTKIKFLKSIWPHILRVNTRVLEGSKFRCPICLDEHIQIGRITECGHCFCGTCLLHHLLTKNKEDGPITIEYKAENFYNFTDLFGHCPLCHEYVSFEHCRPLTVHRVKDYKVNDTICMVLIERTKGEQPQSLHIDVNASTFRKFETDQNEIVKCDEELAEIAMAIKSSDPIYEEPFLQLLSIQVVQYKQYIMQQRQRYNVSMRDEFKYKENFNEKNELMLDKPFNDNNQCKQQQIAYEQYRQSQRYQKKKYVYQSSDGQHIFLHPHNYNMLKFDINYNFDQFPSLLMQCKILQIEHYTQSYDLRRRYPFLAFIPVDVGFTFVELDLSHIVKAETNKYFEKQSFDRQQCRIEKKQMMEEEVKRNKIMEEQRVALQKQKYAKPQIDINDEAEFPSLSGHSKSDSNEEQSDSPLQRGLNELNRSYSSMAVNKDVIVKNNMQANKMQKASSCDPLDVVMSSNIKAKKKKRRHRGGKNRKKKKVII